MVLRVASLLHSLPTLVLDLRIVVFACITNVDLVILAAFLYFDYLPRDNSLFHSQPTLAPEYPLLVMSMFRDPQMGHVCLINSS